MNEVQGFEEVIHPGSRSSDFPHAPSGWLREDMQSIADVEGLSLTDDHWEALRALQEYFERVGERNVNVRQLHDALDEKFHAKGGIKYLYGLFPSGPIAQGCRLAGLPPPAGAVDRGFGSVV